MALEPLALDVEVRGQPVPALLFVPRSEAPLPLVLLGHGAHQSKDDPMAQLLAKAIAIGASVGVALMDAPGHGERRSAGSSDEEYLADVRRRMRDPSGDDRLVEEWTAVAGAARAAAPIVSGPTGYAGFSMGALFGLSIVADLPEVRAALFALGGLVSDDRFGDTDATARNARIRDGARRLGEREILMINMTRDAHFPLNGAIEVFEAIPGPKRMGVWAGTHEQLPPESMKVATDFLARTLA